MAEKVKAPQPSGPDPWRKGWQRRKQSRMRNNARPEPLSPQRKRPLTADGINTKCANKTKDQDQSLLFSRLPIDIRRLIYQEVLASPDHQELHIISSNKRLICHRCDMDDPETPNWAHKCWGETAVDGTSIDWMEDGLGPQQVGMEFHTPVVMGLLCSCRRMCVFPHRLTTLD